MGFFLNSHTHTPLSLWNARVNRQLYKLHRVAEPKGFQLGNARITTTSKMPLGLTHSLSLFDGFLGAVRYQLGQLNYPVVDFVSPSPFN